MSNDSMILSTRSTLSPTPYQVLLLRDMADSTPVSLTFAPTLVRRLLKRLIATGFCEPVSRTFEGDKTVYEFCILTAKGTTYLEALSLVSRLLNQPARTHA